MDEAYRKHHMWAKPKLPELPSTYFRRQGFATFGEDQSGLALAAEFDLVDNFCWASDYPHPEGSWPHSPEAIERQMGRLTDEQRAKAKARRERWGKRDGRGHGAGDGPKHGPKH